MRPGRSAHGAVISRTEAVLRDREAELAGKEGRGTDRPPLWSRLGPEFFETAAGADQRVSSQSRR